MNTSETKAVLPKYFSFAGMHSICRPKDLDRLKDLTVVTKFAKGQLLFSENSNSLGIYCVMDGLVKTYKTLNGKDQIMHISQHEEMLGHSTVIDDAPHDCSASALMETEIHILPKDEFRSLVKQSESLKTMIMELQAVEIKHLHTKFIDILHKPVPARLAGLILLLHRRGLDGDIENADQILYHREIMASMIGTSRESIIRFLASFKEEGIIDISHRSIKILNEEALKKKDLFF